MLLYKALGAIVIFACGIETARRLNARLTGENERTEKYILLLRYIKAQIGCFALPIGEILARAEASLLAGCGWRRESAPTSLEQMLAEAGLGDRTSQGILLEFCKDFGRSYLDEQIRRCDHYITLLEERQVSVGKDIPRRKKLNSTLCISGALALIILLI